MMLAEQSQTWFPTHVQVTVMQARDLNPKSKTGTNDTYTIIQLGKEKYSTSVAEKTLCPVWKEEVSFEFPGLLLQGTPEKYILHLIVMHRSLVGLDKFLGQVAICLNELFENKSRRQKEWFKLESKPGKKSKERGAIQVSIQFMRNNMTASMFDLSMKDKTRSPFAKLKDKMKGRKNDTTFSDHSSAIIPSTSANPDQEALETDLQLKSKPKRAFLLGPQRLSSAQSMSDLPGPRPSLGKIKSNTIGHVVYKPPTDSVRSSEEKDRDSLAKSPHRRSQSMDTSKVNQFDLISVTKNGTDSAKPPADPFSKQDLYMPQKAATLPRSRNPFDNSSSSSWKVTDTSFETTTNYKHPEIKRETKRDKEKDKISLFARVTGKKDVKKSEKASNVKSDGTSDANLLNPFSGNFHSSCEFDSKNPFATKYNTIDMSSLTKPTNSEDTKTLVSTDRRKCQENNQHSSNAFKQHHFERYGEKNRDLCLLATGYRNLSYDELIYELVKQKELVKRKDGQIRELEDYIDNLLVRVMEETPSILRVPYEPSRKAGKLSKNN